MASLLSRTNDSRIRARKSHRGESEHRADLLRLQAGESFIRERPVVLGRSTRCVTARCAALGFFVLPQLAATPFLEVQLAAIVVSLTIGDLVSDCFVPR